MYRVTKRKEWLYIPEWQAREEEVNKQLEEGRLNVADSKEEEYWDA